MMDIYQHYKGGLYIFDCMAQDVNTEKWIVIYRSCKDGAVWARDLDEFMSPVEVNGKMAPRFHQVKEPKEIQCK